MDSNKLIEQIQQQHNGKLLLTGLAALQYPTVQTRQLTFFNPGGGKQEYYIGFHHVLIRRSQKKEIESIDHILFIARHIELYANEVDALLDILDDIPLSDLKHHDKTWRLFAYLKKQCLSETISPKKSIGRRYIDLGDISSPDTIKDSVFFVRDALIAPQLHRKQRWSPKISHAPDPAVFEQIYLHNKSFFQERSVRPLFHRFCRYASRLESAASAKIEGYDASVDIEALSSKLKERMRRNLALKANLNMDNLHRDLARLCKEPLSLDLLLNVQKAIVRNTWRNNEERIDKTPGMFRPFDEVIVDRGGIGSDNVVYVAPKASDVVPLLNELVDFYHRSRREMHPLQMAAIFKCQLVVIHPFGDGNGRLARWCFLNILMREGFIENVHQAPISHIFLQEKDRCYYPELLKVDKHIMDHANYRIDEDTKRYIAEYDNVNIYRTLDYASWITYVYGAFARALQFSMDEHRIFEITQSIYRSFEKKVAQTISAEQEHAVLRAIDIGLRQEWGKKTEDRLLNNKFSEETIKMLREIVLSTRK